MKQYPFPQKRGVQAGLGLFFLALILLSRDTLTALNLVGFVKSQVLTAILVLALGVIFLCYNRRRMGEILKDPRLKLALLSGALLLLPMLLKRDWQLMYFSILFYILTAIFISCFLDIKTISRYYLLILSCLAVYSVICTYGLRILPDRGLLTVPTFRNAVDVEFYNFGLAQVSLEYVKNRNFGIFREPGVYQFFLLLGLFLNNDTAQWEKPWQLWTINVVLAVTMLSTFATGGVIEMGLLAIFLFFDKKWYRRKSARWIAAMLVLAGGCVIGWVLFTDNGIREDLIFMFTKFSDEETGLTRFDAIGIDFEIFFRHPLLGDRVENVLHVVESNSTSTMVLYAFLGFFGGSLSAVSWAALIWDRKRNIFGNLILMVILFMSFNTQNLSWNILFWLFPMAALAQRGLPLLRKGKDEASGA